MLIQSEYGNGEFFVKNQTVYYKGVRISPVNPFPFWSVGTDELYIFPARFPLEGAWLIVVQSRFPTFYDCRKVEMGFGEVDLFLTDGGHIRIQFGGDQLLVNHIYC